MESEDNKSPPKTIQCHYAVLGVEKDADSATIKKAHRKMALKYHPDKNLGDDTSAEQFRLVQQAYECLSDSQERKWYDDHRDAILAGWSANNGSGGSGGPDDASKFMLFDVVPYMYAGCYSGYHNQQGGFYQVYATVFQGIVNCERRNEELSLDFSLPTDFGDETTEWSHVLHFYQAWESFGSALNFAWEDKYNVMEDGLQRRIRRLMEEDNKKARRVAKKEYNTDIVALVHFCKRRDPRVKAKQEQLLQEKIHREAKQKEQAAARKEEIQKAKDAWREEVQRELDEAEEQDRLSGRVRLADLEDDDYDYGGGGGKKGKKKKRGKNNGKNNNGGRFQQQDEEEEQASETQPQGEAQPHQPSSNEGDEEEKEGATQTESEDGADESLLLQSPGSEDGNPEAYKGPETIPIKAATEEDDEETNLDQQEDLQPMLDDTELVDSESEDESEEKPDVWRCECCRKDFKSEGQMENHMKSKKHKEAFKKYQAKQRTREEEDKLMNQMINDMDLEL
jgi:DnaJ homolog subfamily A member 5